ncbi:MULTISPECIES: nascent polypeptide-associated complex domain protein [Oscillospiraceae]|uniref:nascent polypeptide-associated complex domain protein n=1 Tax=Oscillospiraceae TaxID=216572 RepID=UPI0003AE696F|nr:MULTISPECIES: nascent polypeptide-associated complex domain protein [Oscillospiraceae]ERK62999.1 nascent polypeptide-associated complex domain protein [Oscillibacter sp. KLE 1745]ERK65070.1 nascent polypeptide-associated complex domain protein [Oscillibacter sp. KLE 1728]
MAARLTDRQKKKIVADYLECQSVNLAAKKNGVSWDSAKKALEEAGEIEKKLEQKKEENTADILAYMESQKGLVCEIIGKGLAALNDPEKLAEATPAQITTALGTLIDKFTAFGGGPGDTAKDDGLSQSLRELAEGLESDD